MNVVFNLLLSDVQLVGRRSGSLPRCSGNWQTWELRIPIPALLWHPSNNVLHCTTIHHIALQYIGTTLTFLYQRSTLHYYSSPSTAVGRYCTDTPLSALYTALPLISSTAPSHLCTTHVALMRQIKHLAMYFLRLLKST